MNLKSAQITNTRAKILFFLIEMSDLKLSILTLKVIAIANGAHLIVLFLLRESVIKTSAHGF